MCIRNFFILITFSSFFTEDRNNYLPAHCLCIFHATKYKLDGKLNVIKKYSDIYLLKNKSNEISSLEGWGELSFNNLVTDVGGLESGTLAYGALSATTTNTTTLNVQEDGTIVFEGATNDGFETTITVTDPTADRTITFPDATGTVLMTGTTIDGSDTSLLFGDSSGTTDARLKFGASSDIQIYHDGTNSFIENTTGALKIATETSGIAVTIGHTTSEVTIGDNLNIAGTLSLAGTAITKTATQINNSATTGLAVAVAVAL